MLEIFYDRGTLKIKGVEDKANLIDDCLWDERENVYRVKAMLYGDLILHLMDKKVPYEDHARQYNELDIDLNVRQEPFPYQKGALSSWINNRGRGVVVLPTGSGKSYLATLSIEKKKRSTLLLVPTLDLMNQWYDTLSSAFNRETGLIGGGYYDVKDITVTTYDSAYIHMENIGNRFGLIIFDECHHLPGETYSLSAMQCLAPYRLGLTATLERADGQHTVLKSLVGKTVYRKEITELSGKYLADYETTRLVVSLSQEQIEEYQEQRKIYTDFLRNSNINMGSSDGWNRIIMISSQSEKGRKAFKAYRRQKELALGAPAKIELLDGLLKKHRSDRVLVFTQDNKSVYEISKRFLIPAITHQTKVKERSNILSNFNEGKYRAVVTSKVLNEGVNVPEANVGIILSGSGSVTEHIQRLGRILRKGKDKKALLYEIVTEKTTEERISERRRQHDAYR